MPASSQPPMTNAQQAVAAVGSASVALGLRLALAAERRYVGSTDPWSTFAGVDPGSPWLSAISP